MVSQVSGLTKASTSSKSKPPLLQSNLTAAKAVLKKRQAATDDAASKKSASKKTADTSSSGHACPHCAFIGHTNKHPAGVTAETCRANPANFDGTGPAHRASANWIIEKYIETMQTKLKKSGQE